MIYGPCGSMEGEINLEFLWGEATLWGRKKLRGRAANQLWRVRAALPHVETGRDRSDRRVSDPSAGRGTFVSIARIGLCEDS